MDVRGSELAKAAGSELNRVSVRRLFPCFFLLASFINHREKFPLRGAVVIGKPVVDSFRIQDARFMLLWVHGRFFCRGSKFNLPMAPGVQGIGLP